MFKVCFPSIFCASYVCDIYKCKISNVLYFDVNKCYVFKKIKSSLRVLISLIALKETREARVSDR